MTKPLPLIVVHPPRPSGGRWVRVAEADLGVAYGLVELLEILRRAGLDPAQVRLNDPAIKWRGGGPHVWGPEVI